MNEEEIWKDINGFEGLYQVSNLGRVKSPQKIVYRKTGGYNVYKERIIAQETVKGGYYRVHLFKNGKGSHLLVHRLVYAAFCGEIPPGTQVNHINEDKSDNRLENLNLMTPKDNTNWGTANERRSKAQLNDPRKSKPVVGYDEDGNVVVTFPSKIEAARNGYDQRNIWHCLQGRTKTHRGLRWKYKDGDC